MGKLQFKLKKCLDASIVFLIILTSCVHTQVTKLSNTTYPSVDPEEVVVYLTPNDIKDYYEKIGIIHAQGESSWTNEQQMIKAAKKKAASIGANGIILGEMNEPSAGAKVAGAIFGTGTTRRSHAIAIYVYENSMTNYGNEDRLLDSPRVHHINQIIEEDEEETRLPYFRLVVPTANKYSDQQILDLYRKKYSNLKNKSEEALIELIERKHKKKFESKSKSINPK